MKSRHSTSSSPYNDRNNYIKLGNVEIKMECDDENLEENEEERYDNPLEKMVEVNITENGIILTDNEIKKECENPEYFGGNEGLTEIFNNTLQTRNAENNDLEKVFAENLNYTIIFHDADKTIKDTNLLPKSLKKPIEEQQNAYKCYECNTVFSSSIYLEMHVQNHTRETPYDNSIHNEKFTNEPSCSTHIDKYISSANIKVENQNIEEHLENCTGEPLIYPDEIKTEIVDDIKLVNDEVNMKCDVKNIEEIYIETPDILVKVEDEDKTDEDLYSFCTTQKEGKQHLTSTTETETNLDEKTHNCSVWCDHKNTEKKYACNFCRKKFKNPNDLLNHIKIHTEGKPHRCIQCNMRFTESFQLTSHMQVHEGKKIYECDLCKKKFKYSGSLYIHMRVHTGERPYVCEICDKTFIQSSGLNAHMKVHARINQSHDCSVCHKNFSSMASFTSHMRIHASKKPIECRVCKLKFKQSEELTSHMLLHTEDTLYECHVCMKKFNYSSNLIKHMRTHTGDKPYECEICKKTFSQSSALTVHVKIHTGDKPFECTECEMKFNAACHLKGHMRIHTKEKSYECEICNKKFSILTYLNKHMRTHTREKHECDVCQKKFIKISYYNKHMQAHTVE